MNCPLAGPLPGSRAYHALKKLNAVGGGATLIQWIAAAGWASTVNSFHAVVVDRLVVRHKVFVRDGMYYITDDGLLHIGVDLDAPRQPAPVIVAPRYVPPQRPLRTQNMVQLRVMREGAFDYLSIPSRMGSHTVDHKTALTIIAGEPQG